MIKFSTYEAKMSFTTAARRVKSGKLTIPVYLNDDLTPRRSEMFRLGRNCKVKKLITDVWVSNGRINIKTMNKKIVSFTTRSACYLFAECLPGYVVAPIT